jgi:NADPH-dependent glutamate synthase beta subunit-like oxidoreductase
MIDFEKWAFRHGLITNESSPMAVHNAAKALRQLAADVLEEAAKECDAMRAKMGDKDVWEIGYGDCCEDNAKALRTRAAELVKS